MTTTSPPGVTSGRSMTFFVFDNYVIFTLTSMQLVMSILPFLLMFFNPPVLLQITLLVIIWQAWRFIKEYLREDIEIKQDWSKHLEEIAKSVSSKSSA